MEKTHTKIIPLEKDFMFKAVFGNPKNIRILTSFLSSYLNIPYEELEGKVNIITPHIRPKHKNQVRQSVDVLVRYRSRIINIEMNCHSKKTTLVRNMSYLMSLYSNQFMKGSTYNESYGNPDFYLQINFNKFNVGEEKREVRNFFVQDEEGLKLTRSFQIDHINIEYCKEKCYNKEENKSINKWCQILSAETIEEMEEIVGEDIMKKEVKEELLDCVIYLSDEEMMRIGFNDEDEKDRMYKSSLLEEVENAVEENTKKVTEQVANETTRNIASKMLEMNIDIDTISKTTGLTKEQITNF